MTQTDQFRPAPTQIESWEPNWKRRCIVCGTKGTVTGMRKGEPAYKGDMCGVCTWGEVAMSDPDNWNK